MKSTFIDGPGGRYRVRYYRERKKPYDCLAVFPDQQGNKGASAFVTVVDGVECWSMSEVSPLYLLNCCRRAERLTVPAKLRALAETD